MTESTHKIAQNTKDALEMQETYKDKPHGWVQWNCTDVCMDVYCKCGCHSHVDAGFAYNVKCPNCGTIYMCNGHIEFIELIESPKNTVVEAEAEAPEE